MCLYTSITALQLLLLLFYLSLAQAVGHDKAVKLYQEICLRISLPALRICGNIVTDTEDILAAQGELCHLFNVLLLSRDIPFPLLCANCSTQGHRQKSIVS
jgi:hypothetical protein